MVRHHSVIPTTGLLRGVGKLQDGLGRLRRRLAQQEQLIRQRQQEQTQVDAASDSQPVSIITETSKIPASTNSSHSGGTSLPVPVNMPDTNRKRFGYGQLSPFLSGRMFVREPSWKYSANLVGS